MPTTQFNPTSTGQTGTLQTFTAPTAGTYHFTIAGAEGSGGNIFSTPDLTPVGGKGAKITAELTLNAGDVLWILVGQMGSCVQATAKDGTSGGGGGATFIFRLIDAITDSRYQFTKDGQAFEVLFVAAGGGGANDTSYQGARTDGADGNAANIYGPDNYIAPNTASGAPTTSSSKAQGMGIQQFITYDGAGGYYTRGGGQALGGYGGGGSNDDARCAGGGWYGASYTAYSWALDGVLEGVTGENSGDGYAIIEWGAITTPVFTDITLTPNPSPASDTLLVSVALEEQPRIPQEVYPFAGETYAGEVSPWQ